MKIVSAIFVIFASTTLWGQDLFKGEESFFSTPKAYSIPYTKNAPKIDGLADDVWAKATWSDNFIGLENGANPKLNSKVKLLWNKEFLFIYAELDDPHVWAAMDTRDSKLFRENCFEVFLSTNRTSHKYYEIEINPLNTIFDLYLNKPYRDGGVMDADWTAVDMQTAIKVNGTLNNPKDIDKGWVVEMAIPFSALGITVAPNINEVWRANFVRVQWNATISNNKYVKKGAPEYNVWTKHGLINMHYPERWGYLQFSDENAKGQLSEVELGFSEKQKQYLWLVYYKQQDYFAKTKKLGTLEELGLPSEVTITDIKNTLSLNLEAAKFSATIKSDTGNTLSINNESLIY